jgi:transcriptional regulator with XRE-family HTH domain
MLKELERRTSIKMQTIHRLEAGQHAAPRKRTVERLCKALDVTPAILSGEEPMPRIHEEPGDYPSYTSQISVRVDRSARNAFSLVSSRYRIPMARIVEIAPFLFVLAAEASLEHRSANILSERNSPQKFPHLPVTVGRRDSCAEDALDAEQDSIAQKDILAASLPDRIFKDVDHM